MLKASLATLAVSLSVLAATPPADAALTTVSGYVCSTTYTRQNNVWYGNGWVGIAVYSEPFCAGTYVGQVYVLGPGASSLGFQHDQAERLALFGRAHEAAIAGKRVSFFVDAPNNGIFHHTYAAN
jgi:hypothetical protein